MEKYYEINSPHPKNRPKQPLKITEMRRCLLVLFHSKRDKKQLFSAFGVFCGNMEKTRNSVRRLLWNKTAFYKHKK